MATQKEDIRFGIDNEVNVLEVLQNYLQTTLQRSGGYAVMDYTNPGKTIYVELKSRRIKHDTYKSALIGYNKVQFCKNSTADCYFVWLYTDGLYWCKYDPELFDSFNVNHEYYRGEREDCINYAQSIVYVPVEHLSKWENA